jgi:hypothetical protein
MFRMAFIEANGSNTGDVAKMVLPIYNYKNDNPFLLRRIEVKNMPADTLKQVLDSQTPTNPVLDIREASADKFLSASKLNYGFMTVNNTDGLQLKTIEVGTTAKVQIGDPHWDNYDVTAVMERKTGRSIFLTMYSPDEKNYLAFGLTDNGLFLRKKIAGQDIDLHPSVNLPGINLSGFHTYRLAWQGGRLNAYFDGRLVFANIPSGPGPYQGSLGIKVWDDKILAEGLVRSLQLTPVKTPNSV